MGEAWILMAHHVTPNPETPWDVSPEQLAAHARRLAAGPCRFGTIGDLIQPNAPESHNDGKRLVIWTFDDAYENVYRHGFPVLASMGIPATLYVPVDFVGGTNRFDQVGDRMPWRTERIMAWDQIAELARAGWSVQSHGCSHAPFGRLEPTQIADEVRRSKADIENRLGLPVTSLAYPYGDVPPGELLDIDALLLHHGYASAVLAWGGATAVPSRNHYRLPRIILTGGGEDVPAPIRAAARREESQ